MKRPYPNYRNSGVEWLGDIPEHWEVTRLSRMMTCLDGRRIPLNAEQRADLQGPYPYWGANGIVDHLDDWLFDEPLVLLGEDGAPFFAQNKIVSFAVDGKIWVNNHAHVLRPTGVRQRFLTHLLNCTDYAAFIDGSTRDKLTQSDMNAIPVLLPPIIEQCSIEAFLELEVSKIDTLISKKRLLLDRLAEFRTALITRTVTKGLPPAAARQAGLNPAPPLKASGVEWIGDIPEHWELVKNRRLFSERDERSDDGVGELLTVSHITGVTRRSEKPDVGMFMAESLVDYKCCLPGDLIINTMWAWMGAAGTAKEPGLVSPSYNVYMPDSQRLIPRFVDIAYRSLRYVLGMTSESRGIWSSRLRLYPQHFLSLVTAVPPLQEQEAIIAYVDAIETRSERLSATIRMAIERLQEYRTALITAAVTGKIDVRDREMVETGASV